MKHQNNQFLKSWQPLMLKWAVWSIFGVVCMGATNWWDAEPQIPPVALAVPFYENAVFTQLTFPAYATTSLVTSNEMHDKILHGVAVQNLSSLTSTSSNALVALAITAPTFSYSGSGTAVTSQGLYVDNDGYLHQLKTEKRIR